MIIASAIALASAFIPVFWLSLVFVLLITSVIPSDVLFLDFYFLPQAWNFSCFWPENKCFFLLLLFSMQFSRYKPWPLHRTGHIFFWTLFVRFFRYCFIPNGDKGIRTLDPLLARQVLSQLSYTPIEIWQPPAFPCRLQHSIIGRLSLNLRVRDVYGCFP